jgi:hypothetical protein
MGRCTSAALLATLLVVAPASAGKMAAKPPKAPPAAAAAAAAQKHAMTKLLHEEVAALRQEKKVATEVVKAQFQALIGADRLNEKELHAIRAELAKQEKAALALTSDPARRKLIQAEGKELRTLLGAEGKFDQEQIKQLKAMEKGLLAHVKAVYDARIQAVEAQLHALSGKH